MFELLKSMIKEEWRMHSDIFGNIMFALFPFSLTVFAFLGSLSLPIFETIVPIKQIAILTHYTFVLFGLSAGAFGLFGREVMNRRFGHASLIAYSSRNLPVSERSVFLNFFIKDVIFYFLLWILPFTVGISLASPFLSIRLYYSLLLPLTSTLSFLIGLSIIFFLSTIYAHSSKFFVSMFVICIIIVLLTINHFNVDVVTLLPPLSFFLAASLEHLFVSLFLIFIPSSLSIIFLKVEYPEKKKRFKNSFAALSRLLAFSEYSHFISKDFLDLYRSEGGLGKIIFSFVFPVMFIWFILLLFLKFVSIAHSILMFSILLGILSSSIYNWLTEFDSFTSYAFLPVNVSTVIKSKLRSYALLNSISLLSLLLVALVTNQFSYFLLALLSFLAVSSYALSVTIYLAGIYPNILLYNPKIFFGYVFLVSPILLIVIFVSIINFLYLLFTPILLIPSFYLIKASCRQLDTWERPNF